MAIFWQSQLHSAEKRFDRCETYPRSYWSPWHVGVRDSSGVHAIPSTFVGGGEEQHAGEDDKREEKKRRRAQCEEQLERPKTCPTTTPRPSSRTRSLTTSSSPAPTRPSPSSRRGMSTRARPRCTSRTHRSPQLGHLHGHLLWHRAHLRRLQRSSHWVPQPAAQGAWVV